MTQPFGPQSIPEEFKALAEELGVPRETVEVVAEIITLTPDLPAISIAANGQSLGDGTIRVAREYDHQAAGLEEEGKSLVVLSAPESGVQVAFLVDRAALALALTVEIPDVPSSAGPQAS